jgi:hypothetical protein
LPASTMAGLSKSGLQHGATTSQRTNLCSPSSGRPPLRPVLGAPARSCCRTTSTTTRPGMDDEVGSDESLGLDSWGWLLVACSLPLPRPVHNKDECHGDQARGVVRSSPGGDPDPRIRRKRPIRWCSGCTWWPPPGGPTRGSSGRSWWVAGHRRRWRLAAACRSGRASRWRSR